jgi:hypothetical protein
MHFNGGSNVNINFGNQGIAPGGCYGPGHGRGPRGPRGQMMRMMQMMMQMMSQMGGGQQGGCCCQQGRPNFGSGFGQGGGFHGGGINLQIGGSIRGFLG